MNHIANAIHANLISPGQAQRICLNLGASRILIVEDSSADIYQKIILNMSVDDLHFALNESKE